MAAPFIIQIPRPDGELRRELALGQILFLLGANGTGKSSIIAFLYRQYHNQAKRIAAHRQTWLQSGDVELSPRDRFTTEHNVRNQDVQENSRYTEWNPSARAQIALFDLIDAETTKARRIADLFRTEQVDAARQEADEPSPVRTLNELMKLCGMPIEIVVGDRQSILARKNGGEGFSIAELSDGEHNALLIGADVLTAKAGTLLLIDEPERHLHRSIIVPLLRQLFQKRRDCAFVVSTHEPELPLVTPNAATILVRSLEYRGKNAKVWVLDELEPGAPITEDLKRDLLGSRRKILFVEGNETGSLDAPLYSLIFPEVSVVPKQGCRDVEQAVRGLRGAEGMHWVSAWGIVDNDQRSPEQVRRLWDDGVWALSYYAVESLYFHPRLISRIARLQAALMKADPDKLAATALEGAIEAVANQRAHFILGAVLRRATNELRSRLPQRQEIAERRPLRFEIDIPTMYAVEEEQFDNFIRKRDWDGLLSRYSVRQSGALDRVVDGLKVRDRSTYHAMVLTLLQTDAEALNELRALFGDLYKAVMA